jgi:hypothetical protein
LADHLEIIKLINDNLTPQHLGIIMVLIGTFFLAISTKTMDQDQPGLQIRRKDGKKIPANQTYIDKSLFYIGLAFVALGAILQW